MLSDMVLDKLEKGKKIPTKLKLATSYRFPATIFLLSSFFAFSQAQSCISAKQAFFSPNEWFSVSRDTTEPGGRQIQVTIWPDSWILK